MIDSILIAIGFFALGFIVGGVFVLSTSWKIMRKQAKELKNITKDPLIIRVYDAKP